MVASLANRTKPKGGIPFSNKFPVFKVIPKNRSGNKKEVQVEDNKDQDYNVRAISKLLKSAPEDVLFEIFLRLPECRSAISYGSVCRQWHSLISRPQFIPRFIRQHNCNSRPHSIIFRKSCAIFDRPLLELFSNDALVLRGKTFFSVYVSSVVWASNEDLLLLSSVASFDNGVYYIANALTGQLSQLPKLPGGFMVGDQCGLPIGFALVCNNQLEYKVVLIWWPCLHPKDNPNVSLLSVRIFSFGSGQWSVSSFSYPRPNERRYSGCLDVITCNGILYWRESDLTYDRIIALDVFNNRCDILDFPDGFVCGWQNSYGYVWIGVVCKALRLLQIFTPDRNRGVMKIWELCYKGDGSSASWVLVHETNNMFRPCNETLVGFSFQPDHSDVIYMIWGLNAYQYTLTEKAYAMIRKIETPIYFPEDRILSLSIVYPPWPTPIPSIPAI